LCNRQNKADFKKLLREGYHIEHILPKKWNNYDGWTEETWYNDIDKLGNLIPLEWKLNISARNEFFTRKKFDYAKSKVQDAQNLLILSDWSPKNLELRDDISKERLVKFFS